MFNNSNFNCSAKKGADLGTDCVYTHMFYSSEKREMTDAALADYLLLCWHYEESRLNESLLHITLCFMEEMSLRKSTWLV